MCGMKFMPTKSLKSKNVFDIPVLRYSSADGTGSCPPDESHMAAVRILHPAS